MHKALLSLLYIIWSCCYSESIWQNYTSMNAISDLACNKSTLWVGTWGGLAKINTETNEITLLNKTNSGIVDNGITSIAIDTFGDLYVGNRGLQKLSNGLWTKFDWVNPLDYSYVRPILISKTGALYFGNGSHLHCVKNNFHRDFNLGDPLTSRFKISAIKELPDSLIVIGSSSGLFFIKDTSIIKTDVRFSNVNSLCLLNEDTLLISFNDLLVKYTIPDMRIVDTLLNIAPVHSLLIDKKDNLWCASTLGLFVFNGLNWKQFTSTNSPLTDNLVLSLACDEFDNVWVGTRTTGLLKYQKDIWTKIPFSNSGLIENNCPTMAISNENAWFTSGSTVMCLRNKSEWISFNKADTKALQECGFNEIYKDSNTIVSINTSEKLTLINSQTNGLHISKVYTDKMGMAVGDNSGCIWVNLNDRILKYSSNTTSVLKLVDIPIQITHIYGVLADKSGKLWLTVQGDTCDLLISYHSQIFRKEYECKKDFFIKSAVVDSNGFFWFGLLDKYTVGKELGGGLLKFFPNTPILNYLTTNSNLPSNSVTDLAFDADANLWIGTYGGGVAKFDKVSQWENYTFINSGLTDNTIEQVEIDQSGSLWFRSQFSGISTLAFNSSEINTTTNNKVDKLKTKLQYLSRNRFKVYSPRNQSLVISFYTIDGRKIFGIQAFFKSGENWIDLPSKIHLPNLVAVKIKGDGFKVEDYEALIYTCKRLNP